MFKHIVTIAPTIEPVTVEECRQFIGIHQPGDTSRDEIIKRRIKTAREWCEHYANYRFMRQTVTAYGNAFEGCCGSTTINLNAPLVAVNSVKYIDGSGADITLDVGQYLVDNIDSTISPAFGASWPAARNQPNSIRIEYTAGMVNRDELRESAREAICFIVGQWERYQNTLEGGGYPPDFPNVAKSLLAYCFDMRGVF